MDESNEDDYHEGTDDYEPPMTNANKKVDNLKNYDPPASIYDDGGSVAKVGLSVSKASHLDAMRVRNHSNASLNISNANLQNHNSV